MRVGRRFLGGLVVCLALVAATPALAFAVTVSGTVSDEVTHAGIAGVDACFNPSPEMFETKCDETDATGRYEVGDLPAGSYVVRFSADRNNLKYVSEYFDNASNYLELDLFSLGSGDATIDAALAEGGAIAGRITDENTDLPIAGIRACARDPEGFEPRCANSDANGNYLLNGLPTDTYSVEYEGGNRVNYLRELYEDAETWAEATDVPVTVPATSGGIDAKLAPGAEILGHVTDVRTAGPAEDVMVCAEEPDPFGYQACDWTDVAGDYAIRSIPAGTYLVAFNPESYPWGRWAEQWWQGVATPEEATPITIVPPESRSGIDGRATGPNWLPPPAPAAVASTVPPPPVGKKPKPKKCKKGFHRKKVNGNRPCVRKKKATKKGQRSGGRKAAPRAR